MRLLSLQKGVCTECFPALHCAPVPVCLPGDRWCKLLCSPHLVDLHMLVTYAPVSQQTVAGVGFPGWLLFAEQDLPPLVLFCPALSVCGQGIIVECCDLSHITSLTLHIKKVRRRWRSLLLLLLHGHASFTFAES